MTCIRMGKCLSGIESYSNIPVMPSIKSGSSEWHVRSIAIRKTQSRRVISSYIAAMMF